jgi:NAD(P)-dependent dehydrogenase (short-subunit alcohol dehydrogenase family)
MADGRTIVVTGCSSGIGAASATLLKRGGDTIIGVDLNDPANDSVDQFVQMDQSDSESIDKAVRKLPDGIYGVVNSAGVPPAERFPPAHLLKVNFYGLREFTQKLLPQIAKGGAIVNLSSAAGMAWPTNIELLKEALAISDLNDVDAFAEKHEIHTNGMDNLASYPLSKQLLIVWTATAHSFWKDTGVRMNALAPSAIVTPILDDFLAAFGEVAAKRMESIGRISAEEIAVFVQLLLDPAYELLNGSTIPTEKGAVNLGILARIGIT